MSDEQQGVEAKAPSKSDEGARSETIVAFTAELDVPGETSRQARVFAAWLLSAILAVVAGSLVGAHVTPGDEGTSRESQEMSRAHFAKAKVALALGLLLPVLLTFAINRHHRRRGGHARGIVVDVTKRRELRLWGRGYGTRVDLEGAEISERLVDVYAGRLGAWRQRRLRVRGRSGTGAGALSIELAAPAIASDETIDQLRVEGGEGDCVELERSEFLEIRALVLAEAKRV